MTIKHYVLTFFAIMIMSFCGYALMQLKPPAQQDRFEVTYSYNIIGDELFMTTRLVDHGAVVWSKIDIVINEHHDSVKDVRTQQARHFAEMIKKYDPE